jgi:hypothetical protein
MDVILLACAIVVIGSAVFGLCVRHDSPQRTVATILFLVAMMAYLWRALATRN